ncbi:kelch domain-containing protein 8B isoform X2 [Pseudonaja textilis]|uniref:kelch domain-containing protein 8B isoform X2 n=1 Tax=Pseudonaja textilis TaxID=8673 RepID=UPI000EAAA1D3|nr:kelch domain-containing protein 8B isoform X2 [Pseudonaja textilis]
MEAANTKSFFWETFPPMPTCRVYCSPTYQDGHLFVVGGCSQQGQPLDTLEMLDVVSHKWMALPSMATPRAGAAAVMLGKEVLVIGGVDSRQRPLASVEVYHTDEGRWEKKEDLAQPSMGISALEKDGVVYALGGMGADTSPQALLRMYEPAKDHWQPLPSMPTPCYGASTFLHGNKIYVMGGRQGKLPVTAFEAFDLEVRSWTRYPSVPSRRAFASCAMAEGCFFSLGGLQQPGPHNFYSRPHFVNTVEMFDLEEGNQSSALESTEGFNLAKKKWELLPTMPTGRCSCATLEAPNLLFVIGGVAQGPSSAVEALSLQEEV